MSISKKFFICSLILATPFVRAMNFEKFDNRIISNIVRQLTTGIRHETDIVEASAHIAALSLTNKDLYQKIHATENTNMIINLVTKQCMFANSLRAANCLWTLMGAKIWINQYLKESGLF
jgi:hypothetical protein